MRLRSYCQSGPLTTPVIVAVALAVLVLYPPLYGLQLSGLQTVFGYLAEDAFYYLTVAKNSTLGFVSFDREVRTNGFHPLWQYILIASFTGLGGHDPQTELYLSFVLGALLTAIGIVATGMSVYLVTRSAFLPFMLVPGPLYFIFSIRAGGDAIATGITYTYSPWAFMNGMESPCSVMLGGIFLYLMTRMFLSTKQAPLGDGITERATAPSEKMMIVTGLVLALLVAARLDDIFLLMSTALFFLLWGGQGRRRVLNLLLIVLPTVVVLGAYALYLQWTGQPWFVVSGMVKSTSAAAFSGNMATILCDLFPPIHHLLRPAYKVEAWDLTAARSFALFVPTAFAVWLAALIARAGIDGRDEFQEIKWLLPIVIYILCKGLYNLVNVRLGSQGYWYYVLPVLMTNYLSILVSWKLFSRWRVGSLPPERNSLVFLYIVIYLFVSANTIYSAGLGNRRLGELFKGSSEITASLKKIYPGIRLIDRTDEQYAYFLDIPAVSGLGYTLDYDGYVALKQGKLLDYFLRRGFTVTFESPWMHPLPIPRDTYTLTEIYRHEPSGTVFSRIDRAMGQNVQDLPCGAESKPR